MTIAGRPLTALLVAASLGLAGQAMVASAKDAPKAELAADNPGPIAACLIREDRDAATRLALTLPGEPGAMKLYNRIGDDFVACARKAGEFGTARFQPAAMGGVIAEHLLAETNGAMLTTARRSPAVSPLRLVDVPKKAPKRVDAMVVDCAVRAQPETAATMIDAQPATPPEAAAFRSLIPSLQACLPTGWEFRAQPYEVRLIVAASLYRLARQGNAK